jgi:hypothetical protein
MQVRGEKDYTSLVKGLITERSPILGEEQACQDELNFVFDLATGTRVKRKGFRIVAGYTPPSAYNPALRTRFHWADQNLMVDVYQETTTHSGRRDTVFVFLDDFAPYSKLSELVVETPFDTTYSTSVRVSALRDRLFVSSGTRLLVLNKSAATTVEAYSVQLFIRDFKLIPDGLSVGQRTGVLNEEHLYNLYNAGWYAQRKLESSGALGDPIVEFGGEVIDFSFVANVVSASGSSFEIDISGGAPIPLEIGTVFTFSAGPNAGTPYTVTGIGLLDPELDILGVSVTPTTLASDSGIRTIVAQGVSEFPSNADIPVLGLKADEAGDDLFSKNTLQNISMGNSEAPRGHYVYNINSIDRGSRVVFKANDGTPSETVTLLNSVTW